MGSGLPPGPIMGTAVYPDEAHIKSVHGCIGRDEYGSGATARLGYAPVSGGDKERND